MAYFKKKRKPGPSKNELKLARARDAAASERAAGVVRSNYPAVKRLEIHLTFLSAQKHMLEERSLTLSADDACVFEASCPGLCGTGLFDFAEKVGQTVTSALKDAEGSAFCGETLPSGQPCGCEARARIAVDYL